MQLSQYNPLAVEVLRVARADVAHDSPATVDFAYATALREARQVDVHVTEAFDGAPGLDVGLADPPWTPVNTGTTEAAFGSVRAADGSLIIFADNGKEIRSTDNGKTWNQVTLGNSDDILAAVLANDGSIIMSTNGFIFRSTDNGQTSTGVTTVSGISSAVVVADDGSISLAFRDGTGVRSTDNGLTWTSISLDGATFMKTAVRAADGSLILAGDFGDTARSTDNGQTWNKINSGTSEQFRASVLAADGSLILATAGAENVLRSVDNGQTWTVVSTGLGGFLTNLAVALRNPDDDLIVAGRNGTAVRSTDNGQTWSQINIGTTEWMRTGVLANDGSILLAGDSGTAVRKFPAVTLASLSAAELASPGLHSLPVRGSATPSIEFASGGATQGAAKVELTYRT